MSLNKLKKLLKDKMHQELRNYGIIEGDAFDVIVNVLLAKIYDEILSLENPDRNSEFQIKLADADAESLYNCRFVCKSVGVKDVKSPKIIDTSCGSGAFLVEACKENPSAMIFGMDNNALSTKMCKINMAIHRKSANIYTENALTPLENLPFLNKDKIQKTNGSTFQAVKEEYGFDFLKFKEKSNGKYIFYRHKKVKNRLKIDENSTLTLNAEDLKYIYPLVLAPDLKDDGMHWSGNYIIFPYEYGEKQPVPQNRLKETAPNLYNYLFSIKESLMHQSQYNKRIQNIKEFYGVIRVGKYTYSDIFVAIRDNTKLSPCIVSKIKTHWGEYKNPIFDNHISYVAVDSVEEAKYLVNRLKDEKVSKLISKLFDARSIGTRLPINIPKYRTCHERV